MEWYVEVDTPENSSSAKVYPPIVQIDRVLSHYRLPEQNGTRQRTAAERMPFPATGEEKMMTTEIRESVRPRIAGGWTKTALRPRGGALTLAVLATLLTAATPARAVTCIVTSLADNGPGTLRDAIVNQTCDTITFNVNGVIGLSSFTSHPFSAALVISRNLTITGPGVDLLTLQRNSSNFGYRLIFVTSGQTVNISGLTLSNGYGANGGSIANGGTLNLSNASVSGNQGSTGAGAIFNGGTLTLNNCTVSQNVGRLQGAIDNRGMLTVNNSTVSDNYGTDAGGAIDNQGTLIVNNSILVGNSTGMEGGAIRNSNGAAFISNSTLHASSASGGGYGGGAILNLFGSLTISNSTISKSTDGDALGGIVNYGGTLRINNSIVVKSGNGAGPFPIPDISGEVTVGEYNLIGTAGSSSLSATNKIGVDPLLGPVQNNGGPTFTQALLAGSPAINSGDPNFNDPSLPYDQRGAGFARVAGGRIDIGAFEYRPPFRFSGFFQPVDNLPTVNAAKAGSAIPVKFSLDGNQGLNIFAADSPSSQQVACDTAAPLSDIEGTVTAGASSLAYEPATDTYTYVWKTNTAWQKTCRQLIVKLTDNTTHVANFQFK